MRHEAIFANHVRRSIRHAGRRGARRSRRWEQGLSVTRLLLRIKTVELEAWASSVGTAIPTPGALLCGAGDAARSGPVINRRRP
jgi:hypothetical protein